MGVGLVLLSIGTVGGQVLKWATRDKSRQVTI
jgi:hypothetical protein